jgi:hypothetical protein
MQEYLNILKMEDDLNFLSKEDNLSFFPSQPRELIFGMKYGRQPKIVLKTETILFCSNGRQIQFWYRQPSEQTVGKQPYVKSTR